ncbi:uncharacterized protein METZ01_LOCUS301833 [marine metagenome]|uniref:Uncharacterized protein n=1 Tax=marine metagenome TaxID=408172 RepID=A0A382MJF3_9ZZZZ
MKDTGLLKLYRKYIVLIESLISNFGINIWYGVTPSSSQV